MLTDPETGYSKARNSALHLELGNMLIQSHMMSKGVYDDDWNNQAANQILQGQHNLPTGFGFAPFGFRYGLIYDTESVSVKDLATIGLAGYSYTYTENGLRAEQFAYRGGEENWQRAAYRTYAGSRWERHLNRDTRDWGRN